MSPCPDKALMLHGLLDGELDATNALALAELNTRLRTMANSHAFGLSPRKPAKPRQARRKASCTMSSAVGPSRHRKRAKL